VNLSKDHAPSKREEELAVSRSFGDVEYASGSKVKEIISDSEVMTHSLDANSESLLIVSDGIWDAFEKSRAGNPHGCQGCFVRGRVSSALRLQYAEAIVVLHQRPRGP